MNMTPPEGQLKIREDGGGLAEVTGYGQFHLFRMDRTYWWVRMTGADGKAVVVKLTGKIEASHEPG